VGGGAAVALRARLVDPRDPSAHRAASEDDPHRTQERWRAWTSGTLPGLTTFVGGPHDRISDPSVAYDAKHDVWLVSSLALVGTNGAAVVTSRSTDGGLTWSNPVTTAAAGRGENLDKDWTVCDNRPTGPFYGSCYTQFDD
jgi:hypothetical protein